MEDHPPTSPHHFCKKVALCFIISYDHVLQQEPLWRRWIEPNRNWINVYVHYKSLNAIKSPWLKSHALPPDRIVPTSYFHVVPAYVALLSFAYNANEQNTWFCMLTDSCVPCISPVEFRKRFCDLGDKTILRSSAIGWNPQFHRRANLRLFPRTMHVSHDPWFTLTRTHVLKIVKYIMNPITRTLYQTVCAGGLANETVFAVMLGIQWNSEKRCVVIPRDPDGNETIINTSATVADWSRRASATSPFTFSGTPSDLDKTIILRLLADNPYAMFLRKTDSSFNVAAILRIVGHH